MTDPLPAASAEDAAVIQAAEVWVSRLSPDIVAQARWAAPEAYSLITAVRARAARKAPAQATPPAPDATVPVPADSPDPAAGDAHKLSALREAKKRFLSAASAFCADYPRAIPGEKKDPQWRALFVAHRALNAALTPPDPVAELREAADFAVKKLMSVAIVLEDLGRPGTAKDAKVQADRLRTALAALERKP